MKEYTHDFIHINNREVSLADILMGKASSFSAFEETTFTFIQDWFQGTRTFTLKTSGSTGKPKEIVLTRDQLQQSALRTKTALALTENNTALVCLDTKYIAGKMMLVRALECNMTMIAVEPSSNPLQNIITNLSNGFAAFVPLQLQEMMSEQGSLQKLNLLKCMIVGGGAVHASLQKELNKLSCTVYATYGMTETVSHIALQQLNGKESSDHFTVLPGIKISKDNRDCLVIQVPEFSEKIITNDLIDLISSNQFRWLGRFDNVINSGGYKISPEKIEKTLEDVFHNQSFFVTGIADERLGEKLVLFVEGNHSKIDLPEVKLHPYEIPKEVYYLPEFIRTETGKINREKTKSLVAPNQ